MWKEFSDCQEYVYKLLSQGEVSCLSIKKICSEMAIDRSMFYRRYQGKNEFLALCMQYRCREELKKQVQRGIRQDLYTLLKHIKQEQVFYNNIYKITKNGCICHLLIDALDDFISKYLTYYDLRSRAILADDIYCRIYYWVSHHCQQDVYEVWQTLEAALLRIEFLMNHKKISLTTERFKSYCAGSCVLGPKFKNCGSRNGVVCHCVNKILINKINGTSSGRSIWQSKVFPLSVTVVSTSATFFMPA